MKKKPKRNDMIPSKKGNHDRSIKDRKDKFRGIRGNSRVKK